MSSRRPLSFATLSDIMPDVDRLLLGYTKAGNWSLGQVCQHLARVFRYTIEGSPEPGPNVLEERARSVLKRRLLSSGVMAAGVEVPNNPALPLSAGELDERTEAEALRLAIAAFEHHPGPFAAHPLLGQLDALETMRFHCVHSAHHLSNLIPVHE